jgi:mRNA-degrading endonuclease RelE of RelBE toxin-antitoxin system
MQVLFSPTFQRQLLSLDRADALRLRDVLDRLAGSEVPLGKRLHGELHNCFAIRVGANHRLRLIYEHQDEFAHALVIGPRERSAVYIQALQVLNELER